MKKTFKVVMLPTKDKKAPIFEFSGTHNNQLALTEKTTTYFEKDNFKHLYIISDDEIKAGDWVLTGFPKHTSQIGSGFSDAKNANEDFECKKIVITTDKSLTCNNDKNWQMPQIPQSFIEAYVKANGDIKDVMIEMEYSNGEYYYSDNLSRRINLRDNGGETTQSM